MLKFWTVGIRYNQEEITRGLMRHVTVALCLLTSAAPAAVTFTDGNFRNAEWTAAKIQDTTSGGDATFTAAARPNGGVPDIWRATNLNYTAGLNTAGLINVAHLRGGALYDPRVSGAIATIAYSYDLILQNAASNQSAGYTILLFQNSTYYRARDFDNAVGRLWISFRRIGLAAADFQKITGPGPNLPDFSASAAPLQLGFITFNVERSSSTFDYNYGASFVESGIDNWAVTVNPFQGVTCVVVPRNSYLALHRQETHTSNPGRYADHGLGVDVVDNGIPARGVIVNLTATRPIFTSATTAMTNSLGRATFSYSPPTPQTFERTTVTATGSVGVRQFSCLGSVLVGFGTVSAPLQGFLDNQAALDFRDRIRRRLLAFRKTLLADPAFLARVERRERYSRLIGKIVNGQLASLSDADLKDIGELASRIERHAGSQLRKSLADLKRDLGVNSEAMRLGDSILAARGSGPSPADPPVRVEPEFARLPLSFQANRGQTAAHIRYLARQPGYDFFLTPSEVVLAGSSAPGASVGRPPVVRMQFAGANPLVKMVALEELPTRSHYLSGRNTAHWRTNIPHYARVRYEKLYPGIDLVFYQRDNRLQFDFTVAPGAKPSRISLAFHGTRNLKADGSGDLLLDHPGGRLRLEKPFVYQEAVGVRTRVDGRFILTGAA